MSRSGRCRFGDAAGDGFVRSDGAGVVVLKPLAQARSDGDRIYAIILGSVSNNDGSGGGSLTAPAQDAQERLLCDALDVAGLRSSDVDYVEAHGTGTKVGDAIELRALARVLGAERPADRPCRVGSAKTNIGHTEGAAGISGFVKTVLSLHHREIPGNPLLSDPHPALDEARGSLEIPVTPIPWPSGSRPVAGVTSFGLSGTNVHVLLGAAPSPTEVVGSGPPLVLPVSARDPGALETLVAAYADRLDGADAATAEQMCAAAGRGRSHHRWRVAVAAEDGSGLALALRGCPPGSAGPPSGAPPQVAFVFAGHGGQWHGMGRDLLRSSTAFRDALHECDAAVRSEAGWSIVSLLTGDDPAALESSTRIQPTGWAVQVALAAYWRSWGVRPDAVLGHSFGEVAAAHVAGALDLEAAARLICRRAELTHRADGRGGMIAVALPEAEVVEKIAGYCDRLTVAAINSAQSTVVSGDTDVLTALLADLEERSVRIGRVRVPFAGHSAHMDSLRRPLVDALDGLGPGPTEAAFRSTVTGRVMAGPDLDASYWGDNLRRPVRFADAVSAECNGGHTVFLEISPREVLSPALRQCVAAEDLGRHAIVSGPTRDESEVAGMARAAAQLYSVGVDLDWTERYPALPAPDELPRYPWQHRPFWFTPTQQHANEAAAAPERPTIRRDVRPDGSGWNCVVAGSEAASIEIGPVVTTDSTARLNSGNRTLTVTGNDLDAENGTRQTTKDDPAAVLAQEIADVLGMPTAGIPRSDALRLLGADSLAAAEIRVRIGRRWGVNLPAGTVLDSTVDQITAKYLMDPVEQAQN